ncbi:uncharacterized protein LOC126909143 [Daktulosphaira vitifoliae]|uniref:uncharacterized protein LOC126909143 n=1 Tax=Daktulosphaira vitifoliae TaxID=58002 RepID=UPI0021AA1507|nr:uncharacterized protein LOC126909143 [Daktulosphaira vitifoliae]
MYNLFSIIFINFLVFFNQKIYCENVFFPNLPIGEYHIKFKAGFKCNSSIHYKIDLNLHQSKIASSKTVITGNMSFHIPLDDSLIVDVNVAVLDKIGGWKDNAYVFQILNACSAGLSILGPAAYKTLFKSFNATDDSCPIKANSYYLMNNLDVDSFVDTILKTNKMAPKTLFYGSYKAKLMHKRKDYDEILSCFVIIFDVTRPWEDSYHYQ